MRNRSWNGNSVCSCCGLHPRSDTKAPRLTNVRRTRSIAMMTHVHRIAAASVCILLLARFGLAGASLAEEARKQIGVTRSYDPAYRQLGYPGGDVPLDTGVCSDVVVRAFRGIKIDLQKEVHEDMVKAFDKYPQKWGLSRPDPNIDHRRVPNLMTFFRRKGWAVPVSSKATDFAAGDVVTWDLGNGVTHVGIVSDRRSGRGTPLIIHNIGGGAQEEDVLFGYKITGHYRRATEAAPAVPPSAQERK
jgi:uncharacterized protein